MHLQHRQMPLPYRGLLLVQELLETSKNSRLSSSVPEGSGRVALVLGASVLEVLVPEVLVPGGSVLEVLVPALVPEELAKAVVVPVVRISSEPYLRRHLPHHKVPSIRLHRLRQSQTTPQGQYSL